MSERVSATEMNPIDEAEAALLEMLSWNPWFVGQFWPENRERLRGVAADALALRPPPAEALDVGCASGYFSWFLSRLGYRVTAADSADTPSHFEGEFLRANLNDPAALSGVADGRFGLVVMGEVIEHVLHHPLGLMREVLRVTRPGGVLVLTTPNPATAINAARTLLGRPYQWGTEKFIEQPKVEGGAVIDAGDIHYREYTRGELLGLLAAAGFEVLRHRYCGFGAAGHHHPLKRAVKKALPGLTRLRLFGPTHYVVARRPD